MYLLPCAGTPHHDRSASGRGSRPALWYGSPRPRSCSAEHHHYQRDASAVSILPVKQLPPRQDLSNDHNLTRTLERRIEPDNLRIADPAQDPDLVLHLVPLVLRPRPVNVTGLEVPEVSEEIVRKLILIKVCLSGGRELNTVSMCLPCSSWFIYGEIPPFMFSHLLLGRPWPPCCYQQTVSRIITTSVYFISTFSLRNLTLWSCHW